MSQQPLPSNDPRIELLLREHFAGKQRQRRAAFPGLLAAGLIFAVLFGGMAATGDFTMVLFSIVPAILTALAVGLITFGVTYVVQLAFTN